MGNTDAVERISLLDSIDNGRWFKLPLAVVKKSGPATQTLAGLLKITNRSTFTSVGKIATAARVPLKTARKHLATLEAAGWIENHKRQPTRTGRTRRTCTLAITRQTKDALEPYIPLPWWACCPINKRLNWGSKVLLAVVMGRLMSLMPEATEQYGPFPEAGECDCTPDCDCGLDTVCTCEPDPSLCRCKQNRIDEIVGAIDNMGGDDRFRFPLHRLQNDTGLSRHSIIRAKANLHRLKIIGWQAGERREDGGTTTDYLVPNHDFRVIVRPAGEGLISLSFGTC